jgi:serine-threonine kinase receptor-associated protein
MLRNGTTGDWIGTFEGHKGAVWSAKLNTLATKAATASADFSVKLWDALGGGELCTWDHQHIVKTVDFSRDVESSKLLTGGQEKLLRVFDLTKPQSTPLLQFKHPHTVRNALWSTGSGGATFIFSGCNDGKLRLFDTRAQASVQTVDVGDDAIADMELSRDGEVLTIAAGKRVLFYDAATLTLKKEHALPRVLEAVSLHPGPQRKTFLAGGTDLWVRVFDYETCEELECFKGHHGPVHCLRYAPDGSSFASGSDDATIRIWKAHQGQE